MHWSFIELSGNPTYPTPRLLSWRGEYGKRGRGGVCGLGVHCRSPIGTVLYGTVAHHPYHTEEESLLAPFDRLRQPITQPPPVLCHRDVDLNEGKGDIDLLRRSISERAVGYT